MQDNKSNNTSLIKSDVAQAIIRLRSTNLARRGLRDAGFWPKIEELLKKIDEHFMADQYSQCIELSTEVLTLDPFNFIALYYRAICYEFTLEYDLALQDLEKALQIEPYNATLIAHKGICLILSGGSDGEAWLDRALDIDKNTIVALYYKAELAITEEDALTWWNRLITLQPRDVTLLLGRAELLAATGNYRDAIADYEHALLDIQPAGSTDTPALMKLSECYSRVGRYDDARRIYNKILKIEPTNLYALRALERLS